MLYVTRKYGRPNRKERNKTKKRKTITWTCIVCWNGYSTMQRTTFIDWKTIVLSSYWHSWLTISIEKGGFYNGGISFNHLQLLAGWVHGCFRTRFNRLRDQTAWYIQCTLSDDPELPLKSKTKKNGLSRHCLWGDKMRLFRQQRFGCLLAPPKFTAAGACSP